jgi:predicted RNase H-like nuclease (RuvC/YqgF family)
VDASVVVACVAAGAAIVAAIISARSSRRATDVNEQAANLEWVKELRRDAVDARKEVAELRSEVRELRRQLAVVTGEADYWINEHQALRRHAWRPGMTIERLRELLGHEPPPVGQN